ncbi:MAG TPA: ABC transporter permease [Candidatus Saccharibacteria bacterium]|nr:ABC transporter permease [Candidatus Saccharibacteria bacterium]MCB9817652.1 ABC transporter permease [Candidatus Nomurabacteria bacterium]HPR10296.1 ABC transporter permease [Candidatus Saccharibacteria bacterium]
MSSFYTIKTIAVINTKRFFRDKLAIFFTIAFPLIFLIIFGSLFNGDNNVSFKVALINESSSQIATQFVNSAGQSNILKIDSSIDNKDQAVKKMQRSELDATIILPQSFGQQQNGIPSGQVTVLYNENSQQAGSALSSILKAQMDELNKQFVDTYVPFTVVQESTKAQGLSQFDYTFAGLVGFAIISLGIFGPTNVFPELKKQGVLRRLHTTPLKVRHYFIANVGSQGLIGMLSIATMFIFSLLVFDLQMKGSYVTFAAFVALSIVMIYGIGLAIGGWAKNERQAAPLSNLVTFPMIFLSGTFFPRFLMPEWLQSVTNLLPLTPVIDGVRLIVTEGKGMLEILPQVGLVAVWALVIYLIAFRVFRWE